MKIHPLWMAKRISDLIIVSESTLSKFTNEFYEREEPGPTLRQEFMSQIRNENPALYSLFTRQELQLKHGGLPSYEAYITGAMVLYGLLEAQLASETMP